MNYFDIKNKNIPNFDNVDQSYVNEIKQSLILNGWKGCPLLLNGDQLLVGSHRMAALNYPLEYEMYADLRNLFAGTWIENYKNEIIEW